MTSFRWYLRDFAEVKWWTGTDSNNELWLVVFKLNMQTILNPDFHLYRIVTVRGHSERMYPDILLLSHICHSARNRYTYKISENRTEAWMKGEIKARWPQLHVDTLVTLELLLDVLEVEIKRLGLPHLPWRSEFLRKWQKFMMVASVVEQLWNGE